jgi:hypothetical protein
MIVHSDPSAARLFELANVEMLYENHDFVGKARIMSARIWLAVELGKNPCQVRWQTRPTCSCCPPLLGALYVLRKLSMRSSGTTRGLRKRTIDSHS